MAHGDGRRRNYQCPLVRRISSLPLAHASPLITALAACRILTAVGIFRPAGESENAGVTRHHFVALMNEAITPQGRSIDVGGIIARGNIVWPHAADRCPLLTCDGRFVTFWAS